MYEASLTLATEIEQIQVLKAQRVIAFQSIFDFYKLLFYSLNWFTCEPDHQSVTCFIEHLSHHTHVNTLMPHIYLSNSA